MARRQAAWVCGTDIGGKAQEGMMQEVGRETGIGGGEVGRAARCMGARNHGKAACSPVTCLPTTCPLAAALPAAAVCVCGRMHTHLR